MPHALATYAAASIEWTPKATGRPVSTRFRNDMDEVKRQEKRCGLCRQVSHTRRGCPNQPTEEA
ncbi:uncharacterized protein DS421_11g335810 [Arachis hypogaea]|nr:uncharacterized protein DS421_11g335810 [Arachis hypogaea]